MMYTYVLCDIIYVYYMKSYGIVTILNTEMYSSLQDFIKQFSIK